MFNLFNQEEGFPGRAEKAFRYGIQPVTGTTYVLEFADLPPGRYAVGVVHDENGNHEVDANWMGYPKEGFGFTNNAKPRWNGPPRFESAAFVVKPGESRLEVVTLQY